MKSKNTQRITDVIRQFRLSSVTIERSYQNGNLIVLSLACLSSLSRGLEETICELFDVDLSKITEGLSQQKDVMKLFGGDEQS